MRALSAGLLLIALFAPADAGEGTTAAGSTERGRSLARILDIALLPEGQPIEGERTLTILLDATSSLQSVDLPEKLKAALQRNAPRLGKTRIGVARVGGKGRTEFTSPSEGTAIVQRASAIVESPEGAFQNVYADLRRVAVELKRRRGQRDLLLVTLENGDAEDDLEGTVSALRQADVRVHVAAKQAFLSDTYWVGRSSQAPPGLELAGPESAFVEMPWGFLFQQGRANEGIASGFASYGLSRVAETTGGRVFLYYPPSKSEHRCVHYGTCPFCKGDHVLPGDRYQSHRLQALAPQVGPRREVLAQAGRDPYYRALLRAWESLAKKGLVASRPSVKRTGGSLQLRKRPLGRYAEIGASISFASQATRAGRLLGTLSEITRGLEDSIGRVKEGTGSLRYRAMAETTAVLLRIQLVNLHLFIGFCREVGPVQAGKRPSEYALPEIPFFAGSERFRGIGWTSLSLCHGVRPFAEIYLPGGEAVRGELRALEGVVGPFLDRYAHTPFAALVRRSGLARFNLTVRGKYVPPPKRKVPGGDSDETTTTPDRPARGGPSTGGGGSPTTGGD